MAKLTKLLMLLVLLGLLIGPLVASVFCLFTWGAYGAGFSWFVTQCLLWGVLGALGHAWEGNQKSNS